MTASATCVACGEPVDERDPATLREVVGWDRYRGAVGGQNHVRHRKETGRVICGSCATRWLYAGSTDQTELEL